MANETELSEREREILCLVSTGASNKEIAQQLFISTNTVKVHLRNIFAKIGVTSRTEATLFAIREGLVPTPANLPPQALEAENGKAEILGAEDDTRVLTSRRRTGVIALLSVAALIFFGMLGITIRQLTAGTPTPVPQATVARWQERAPLPSPRSGLAAAVYDDQIYAIGGETAGGVTGEASCFSPTQNSWRNVATKPTPVADIRAVVIGGMIYVPGGRLASGQPTDILEIYDPRLDRWSRLAPMPMKLFGYAIAAVDGKLFLFGGWNGVRAVSTVYEYDPGEDAWKVNTPMIMTRAFAGSAVVAGKIYIIGGTNGKNALKETEVYSPEREGGSEPVWQQGAALPVGRTGASAVGLADNIYLFGTSDGPLAQDNQPLVYVVDRDEWQKMEQSPSGITPGAAAVGMQSNIFLLGGKSTEGYSANNSTYKAIFTLNIPVYK